MDKQTNKIPLVRFPEFKDDWENKRFDEFLIHTPRPRPKPKNKYLSIGIRSHFKGTFQKLNTDPNKNAMDTLYEIKENDFLVNITFAWEGALAIVTKENDGGFVSHRFPTYTIDNGIDNLFFKYHFFREKSKHQLGIISPGGSGRNRVMNKKDFIKLKLPFPQLKEQKKIVHFFSIVDQKINQLQEKQKTLEQYKKGIIQQIFSQQLRFKDENRKYFPDWEVKKLGEVCEIKTGNKDTQDKLKNGKFSFYVRSNTIERIDTYSYEGEAILTSGDGVGKNFHYLNGKFDFHQRVYSLRKFDKNYSGKFIYIVFSSQFYKRVKRLSAKNSVDSVRMDMISKMDINFPSLPEQTKIANFLSKIDAKINAVNKQIETTKTYKKGLLQRMFV